MNTSTQPFSILQISDMHVLPKAGDTLLGIDTEYYFRKVLAAAHEEYGKFDLILVSGDISQQPCVASYQRVYNIFSEYKTQTVCFPGNHDDYSLMQWLLNKGYLSCDKRTLLEKWQIICLNSQKPNEAGGLLAMQELDFLEKSLEQRPKPYAMIAVHHHCVLSGSAWLDTMLIENSDKLFNGLKQYPEVKLIVTGHIHQEVETRKNGIAVLSVPSTCFQFKPRCKNFTLDQIPPGYRSIQLYDDGQFKTKVHRLTDKQEELQLTTGGY